MMVAAVLAAANTEPFYILNKHFVVSLWVFLYVIIWNEDLAY